ncbi:Uncharacterised protein [Vibrio harveyi]|nr:Uncharacterised protein [Vibrio harveyi]
MSFIKCAILEIAVSLYVVFFITFLVIKIMLLSVQLILTKMFCWF